MTKIKKFTCPDVTVKTDTYRVILHCRSGLLAMFREPEATGNIYFSKDDALQLAAELQKAVASLGGVG